ncbi:hypothetical protein [Aquimarina longa]|uniref:hypothetical protein n=1 Tax=Aquimarina longa TaxID=1080221 RepID=UPI000782121F|nr:hypothetical protein [Aquimarina longa]
MNITFPTDNLENKKIDFRSEFGNFLIGGENTWHGGIHIEGKDNSIKAIADGRIIAYRFTEDYKEVIKKNIATGQEHLYIYSNCFIIIQHDFDLVKHLVKNKGKKDESIEKKVENITFYSLYNHLLPLDSFNSKEVPHFMSKKACKVSKKEGFPSSFKTGLNARILKLSDSNPNSSVIDMDNSGIKLVIPYQDTVSKVYDNEGNPIMIGNYAKVTYTKDGKEIKDIYICTKDYKNQKRVKDLGDSYQVVIKEDTPKTKGARVRTSSSGDVTAIIPYGEEVTIIETNGNWYTIKGYEGVSHKGNFLEQSSVDKSKITTDTIVPCDIPIKKGKLIGHTGLKQSRAKKGDYYVCHHEIFMADNNDDKIKKFLNDDFNIHSEEEKPLDKKKYYKLPKDVILYKTLKVPDNATIRKKTPVKVIAKKDKFCKVKILDKVERIVEKSALVVNNQKTKGKKIVYNIANFNYISKIFDSILSEEDTLTHIEDVENSLVKVSYEPEGEYIDYNFWIPFSDLSKNYEYEIKNTKTKVYKSVRNAKSIIDYMKAPRNEPEEIEWFSFNFLRNILNNNDQPEEVERKNVTKKTYKAEEEKELLKFVPHQLLVDAGATYVNSTKSRLKKGGANAGHYPVTATKIDSFNKINTIFEGKLNKAEISPLFYTHPGLNCNAEGGIGTSHRRVTYVYKEVIEKNIVPNIIHEDEKAIQAIIPVELYRKIESSKNYRIIPIDNTGQDPKVHEHVDTLFVFFENKLPNVSSFELKWKEACNEKGDRIRPINKATHRLLEFNIEEFNQKQEIQSHKLKGGYTPKVGDEVGLVKDVTDIWLARPDNNKDTDITLEKPTIVKTTNEKDIILGEENGNYHYKQVVTHNLYLGNENETIEKGWVKIDKFNEEKFFSPYNWNQFGFTILDGGDEYIYAIKDTPGHTDTKSDFIKKIWKNFNILGPVIDASEVRFALGMNEVRYEMSRVVAKHKNEWSYKYEEVEADVEKFYTAQIKLAKKNKRKQDVIDKMENQKQEHLNNLKTQVTDLMFWDDASKPYVPKVRKVEKPILLKPKSVKLDFGVTDEHRADYKEQDTPVTTAKPTTTASETKPAETKKEKPKQPERIFPASPNVYHFHPIAFINQMRLMFGEQTGECYCNRDLTTEEFKNIFTRIRKSEKLGNGILNHSNCAIPSDDKTFERLTEELNKTTKKYGINQCVQKMHFIAQLYWESARFTTGLEFADSSGYNPGQHDEAINNGNTQMGDGPKYKGRGFMQLTWRNSQIKYLKYAAKFDGDLKGKTDEELELRSNNYETYISENLYYAMDSAGWFWSNYKKAGSKHSEIKKKSLNEIALFGDKYINYISTLVNGGGNGKSERRKYYSLLRNIFKYDFVCINNENRQDIESSDIAPWVKFVYQEFAEYQGLNETESPLKEKIVKYHKPGRKSGDHTISWCASFVNWCFVQAGYPNINSGSNWYAFDWAPEGNTKASDKDVAGLTGWKEGEKCEAFVGAIVVLNYSHCAIIVGKNTSLNKYVYIGGNQGNGSVSGTQQIKYGTVTIGNEYAIMKPIKYNPTSYELPEMNENADGSYASTR